MPAWESDPDLKVGPPGGSLGMKRRSHETGLGALFRLFPLIPVFPPILRYQNASQVSKKGSVVSS